MKREFKAKAGESEFNCKIEGTKEEIKEFEEEIQK